MPRPRTVSDEAILACAARVVGEVGPARLTLALVARAAGLAPPSLVQRFGSKRQLLLALARTAGDDAERALARARAGQRAESPLAVLRRYLLGFAQLARTPDELANHLAFLQMDLTDPEFRGVTATQMRRQDEVVEELLREAIAAGEIAGEIAATDAPALARALVTAVNGSLLRWAIFRKGDVRRWLRRDLDYLLTDTRLTAARRSSASRRRAPAAAPRG